MPIYKMEGKKNGLQKYRVRVNFTNAQGKADSVERVAYGYEDAKEKEAKLLKDIKETPPAKRMTVGDLYDEYIEWQETNVRKSTLRGNKSLYEHYIEPYLKDKKIADITVDMLRDWKIAIDKLSISTAMKQHAYAQLRGLLNYAVKFNKIPNHPLGKIGNFSDSNEIKKEMDFYTPEEFKKFIMSARENAEKKNSIQEWGFYVLFNILFYTGARKGEANALKWIRRKGDMIMIRESVNQKVKGDDVTTPPKNKSSVRNVKLPLPLIKVLDEHYERCKDLDGFSDEWYVCGCLRPLRDSTIENRKKLFAQAAGVKEIRIHDFRHSHASLLAHEGINIQEIARRLGHAKTEMTWNTYSHLYPIEEDRAIQVLNNIE